MNNVYKGYACKQNWPRGRWRSVYLNNNDDNKHDNANDTTTTNNNNHHNTYL